MQQDGGAPANDVRSNWGRIARKALQCDSVGFCSAACGRAARAGAPTNWHTRRATALSPAVAPKTRPPPDGAIALFGDGSQSTQLKIKEVEHVRIEKVEQLF
jgi:hypothetical protein